MLNRRTFLRTSSCLAAATVLPSVAFAQSGPLRLEITEGVIEPLPFALPTFIAENAGASDPAADISRVIAADLRGTGLFRQISPEAYIAQVTSFNAPVSYPDWQAINAQALITGSVEARGDGQLVVRFRLFDVFSQAPRLARVCNLLDPPTVGVVWPIPLLIRFIPGSLAKAGISTPALPSSPRKGRKMPASNAWQSWITTAQMFNF